MANDAAPASTGGRSLGRLERLPTRKIVLTALTVAIFVVVGGGIFKTFTLPAGERPGFAFLANLFVIGLALGSVYALIALGYSLVYGILRMINFAHGEVFMFGAFASFFFASAYSRSGFLNSQPIIALAILFASGIVVSVGVAVLLERVAYRPLRNAPRLVPLITAIGASLFLQNTAQGFFGSQTRGYPRPSFLEGSITIGSVSFDKIVPVVVVTSIVVMVVLELFVQRTRTGKSMRAVAQDREIASLMGIDVDRVVVITFIIGGTLAGIAGVLYALTFGVVGADHGVPARYRRVHRGRARRHRQHPGGRDRRLVAGHRRIGGPDPAPQRLQRPLTVRAARRRDVLDLGARLDLPAGRDPGHRRGGEGLMHGDAIKLAVRVGAIAGLVVWFLALVGMIERLSDLSIIGTGLTMDQLLIFLPSALAGWVAVRPQVVAGEIRTLTTGSALAVGAAAGLATGAVVAAGLGLVNLIGVETVRTVFISLSPTTMDQLYLGLEPHGGNGRARDRHVRARGRLRGCTSQPAGSRSTARSSRDWPGSWRWRLLERVVAPAFDQTGIEKDWLYSKAKWRARADRGDRDLRGGGRRVRFAVASKLHGHPAAGPVARPGGGGGALTDHGEDGVADREASDGDDHPLDRRLSARGLPDHRLAGDRRAARVAALPRGAGRRPHPGAGRHLPAAGPGVEHRGRVRGAARPRVRGVLRGGRLLHRDPHGRATRDVRRGSGRRRSAPT